MSHMLHIYAAIVKQCVGFQLYYIACCYNLLCCVSSQLLHHYCTASSYMALLVISLCSCTSCSVIVTVCFLFLHHIMIFLCFLCSFSIFLLFLLSLSVFNHFLSFFRKLKMCLCWLCLSLVLVYYRKKRLLKTEFSLSCLRALKTVDELVQKIEFDGPSISITSRNLALGISALNTTMFNGTSFSAFMHPNTTDPQVTRDSQRSSVQGLF